MANLNLTNSEASNGILTAVSEKTLTQGVWHGNDSDGRHIACLLGSMHPNVNKPSDCNGDLMPMWMAELTPTLFDDIDVAQIYPIAKRYGQLVARWNVLRPVHWDAILTHFLVCVWWMRPCLRQGQRLWTSPTGRLWKRPVIRLRMRF